jgi:hypothetical protein
MRFRRRTLMVTQNGDHAIRVVIVVELFLQGTSLRGSLI